MTRPVPLSVFCLISKELLDTLQVFLVRNLCNSRNFRKFYGLKKKKARKAGHTVETGLF